MTAPAAETAPNCPKCKRPREVFTSFGAVDDLALCRYCFGFESPPIIVKRQSQRQAPVGVIDRAPLTTREES